MTREFDEGDVISVPCRHCATLALRIEIRAGSSAHRCARCGRGTTVYVRRSPDESWVIRTEQTADARIQSPR